MLSNNDEEEPRFQIGMGFQHQLVYGMDVNKLAPGKKVTFNESIFGFPFESLKVNDTLRYVTPKGKVVYGGGGIVPDVFVGIDTTTYFGGFHPRIMNDFVFEYVDTHRKEMDAWNFDDFKVSFDSEDVILKQYTKIIEKEINIDPRNIPFIKRYLKSLFAQLLFDDGAFYEILNEKDLMIEKVQELESVTDYIKP